MVQEKKMHGSRQQPSQCENFMKSSDNMKKAKIKQSTYPSCQNYNDWSFGLSMLNKIWTKRVFVWQLKISPVKPKEQRGEDGGRG